MRQGFLGAFQLGALDALHEALRMAENIAGKKACDLENLFYITAFQAGIDRFLIPDIPFAEVPRSTFVSDRTKLLSPDRSDKRAKPIRSSFDALLPPDWRKNKTFDELSVCEIFIIDLIEAMHERASFLSVSGIPDPSILEASVPRELITPFSNLVSQFENISAPSVVPRTVVPRDSIERLQESLTSKTFSHYVDAHAHLDREDVKVSTAINRVLDTGREVVKKSFRLLAIRRQCVSVLTFTPKLIDTIFGKLPGALSEVAAKAGIGFIQDRQRLVIYDFRDVVFGSLFHELARIFKEIK